MGRVLTAWAGICPAPAQVRPPVNHPDSQPHHGWRHKLMKHFWKSRLGGQQRMVGAMGTGIWGVTRRVVLAGGLPGGGEAGGVVCRPHRGSPIMELSKGPLLLQSCTEKAPPSPAVVWAPPPLTGALPCRRPLPVASPKAPTDPQVHTSCNHQESCVLLHVPLAHLQNWA